TRKHVDRDDRVGSTVCHQLCPGVRLGILRTIPAASSRGLSRLLASAIGRHWAGLSYCCQAISLSVCPRFTCTSLVRSLLNRGVWVSCWSMVQASRNVTLSLARSGTPEGLKSVNSWLTLSTTHQISAVPPLLNIRPPSPHSSFTRGGACVSERTSISR